MKTQLNSTLARLTIAAAVLAASVGISAAGEIATAKGGATTLIYLHAPNNATPSVTVWIPKVKSQESVKAATAKGGASKLTYLHAPNNATQSVTVWTGR